jgi:hypothetical protein
MLALIHISAQTSEQAVIFGSEKYMCEFDFIILV